MILLMFCVPLYALLINCSIPNLEDARCTESRGAVKEFYSYHFGNDMKFTPENLSKREKFLTAELSKTLNKLVTESDPFTLTDSAPKAFRIGRCSIKSENSTDIEILLFWRDDTNYSSKEIPIHVEVINQEGKWLIDTVYGEQLNLKNLNH